jgi:hypothetical protein
MRRTAKLLTAFVFALVALALSMGCEDNPQDRIREAQAALASNKPDLAEQRLHEALSADPEHFEAQRLLAQVDVLRADYAAAEEKLFALWQARGLDEEADLDAVGRRHRSLVRDQFNDLYRRWSESIDQGQHPDLFEEVARKGLERDPRNARLNAVLSDFYQERAERMIERGEKIRAAEELEKIESLRIFADVRRQTRERALNLRREAFAVEARQRFEEHLLPELLETDSYDGATETIRIAIDQTVDRSLDHTSDEARQQVRQIASQSLVPTLARLAIALTGLETEEVEIARLEAPEIGIDGEDFQRGRYRMVATFSLGGLIEMAFGYAEFERTREVAPDPEAVADQADVDPGQDGEQESSSPQAD